MMLLRLFWEFFKIGLFAVGGGMATIPFLYDLSDRTGWFTHTQLADMIAISESTPGPIGVNMATYVGYEMSGIPGSIFTTLGFVAPSIIIIIIVSLFLQKFRENRYVESAFYGLRPASSGLIASAALSVAIVALLAEDWSFAALPGCIRWPAVALAVFLFIVTNLKKTKKWHPIVFLGFSAVVGIVFGFAEPGCAPFPPPAGAPIRKTAVLPLWGQTADFTFYRAPGGRHTCGGWLPRPADGVPPCCGPAPPAPRGTAGN